ncbi:hypothetical protein FEM48_Zijuj04G0193700 [Ziziphus jujuba var. spinosa]|uniref:Disease resistance protein At4g27190-like leucine-rich repeats domain-containing protein n=1 Tax=Ziziphus jujuba var. spinosa TaxID=714518 RepID=A0A978VLQ4_ZIZJJ|nr:hypothetical protein FEM48_Zijuj04G0193700 [Ziziphus jujuba var. spinosa]
MAKSFMHVRTLRVICSELLKEVVVIEESGDGIRSQNICFPALKSLELVKLQNLEKFWAGDHIECPILETLRINSCSQLSTFISNYTDEAVQPVLFSITRR